MAKADSDGNNNTFRGVIFEYLGYLLSVPDTITSFLHQFKAD